MIATQLSIIISGVLLKLLTKLRAKQNGHVGFQNGSRVNAELFFLFPWVRIPAKSRICRNSRRKTHLSLIR